MPDNNPVDAVKLSKLLNNYKLVSDPVYIRDNF